MSHGSTSGRVHIHDESHMPRTCWKRKVVTARSGARHVGQTTTKLRTVRKVTRGSWITSPSNVKEANLGKGVEAGGWPSLCKGARQAWPAPSQTATPQQFRGWTAVCEGWFGRVHIRDESHVRRDAYAGNARSSPPGLARAMSGRRPRNYVQYARSH